MIGTHWQKMQELSSAKSPKSEPSLRYVLMSNLGWIVLMVLSCKMGILKEFVRIKLYNPYKKFQCLTSDSKPTRLFMVTYQNSVRWSKCPCLEDSVSSHQNPNSEFTLLPSLQINLLTFGRFWQKTRDSWVRHKGQLIAHSKSSDHRSICDSFWAPIPIEWCYGDSWKTQWAAFKRGTLTLGN